MEYEEEDEFCTVCGEPQVECICGEHDEDLLIMEPYDRDDETLNYFAGQALMGFVSSERVTEKNCDEVAIRCWSIAESMMKHRPEKT